MTIVELIEELQYILDREGEDIEINEYWLRVITGVNIQQYINGKQGLYLVKDLPSE